MRIDKWIKRVLIVCLLVVSVVVLVTGLIDYQCDPTRQSMWHVLLGAVMVYAIVVYALVLKSVKVI